MKCYLTILKADRPGSEVPDFFCFYSPLRAMSRP